MGTRHLTVVKLGGHYRVAQYGQWDGYPSGAGKTILDFLSGWDRSKFEQKLMSSSFITYEEIAAINETIRAEGLTDAWQKRWPSLTRDTGADILALIQNAPEVMKLKNSLSFAADSLFCEWAYVLDLDANKLEVYKVFNKTPLADTDRFFGVKEPDVEDGYYPVRKVAEYALSGLPDVEAMEKDCETKDSLLAEIAKHPVINPIAP